MGTADGDPQSLAPCRRWPGAGFGMALALPAESRNKARSRLSGREVCSLEGGAKQSAHGMSRPEIGPQEQPEPNSDLHPVMKLWPYLICVPASSLLSTDHILCTEGKMVRDSLVLPP